MTSFADKMTAIQDNVNGWDTIQWVLFSVGSLCLAEWGFAHIMAFFFITIPSWTGNIAFGMIYGIAGASGIDYSAYTYPVHTNRVFIQHGINLGVFGLFAYYAIGAMLLNWESANLIAFAPYLADIGYFTAIDLPELGAITSQVQTYIISIGIFCVATFTYR